MTIPEYDSTIDPNNPENHAVHQFCNNPSCPCKEDPDEISLLESFVENGLASVEDANNIYYGRVV